jgi:hypothetical protein
MEVESFGIGGSRKVMRAPLIHLPHRRKAGIANSANRRDLF